MIFVPPIISHATVPNHGIDTYYHIQRITGISQGIPQQVVYWGDYIIGYPLIVLSKIGIPIAISYMWFSFFMLWLVGISIYMLISFLFKGKEVVMTLFMVFSAPSIWNLYDTGALYDLMTVGIMLPLLIICIIKVDKKQWRYIPHAIVLLLMAILLHSVGIIYAFPKVFNGSIVSEQIVPTLGLMQLIDVPIIMFGSFLIGYLTSEWHSVKLERSHIIAGGIMVILMAIFIPLSMVQVTGFAIRFGIDTAIIISIFVMCLMGLFLSKVNDKRINYLTFSAILTSGIPVFITYIR